MNVIIDTNVLISGIFFKGPPHEILLAWKKNKFKLITSHEIIEEYKRVVLELSIKFPDIDVSDTIDQIIINSKLSLSLMLPDQICDDPDDDKFIAVALASKTKIIISGDKHLLSHSGYAGIDILKPAEFLLKYLNSK